MASEPSRSLDRRPITGDGSCSTSDPVEKLSAGRAQLRPFRLQAGNYRALIRDCGHAQSECIRGASRAFFGGGHGLGKCRGGHYANQRPDNGYSKQPLANLFMVLSFHWVRSREPPRPTVMLRGTILRLGKKL
jgi:hypothetical protein